MARYLFAVLVGHSATVESIDIHLAGPLRPLIRRGDIDSYRLGGACTGAWDPGYDPSLDPRNWRPCDACGGSTRLGGRRCPACTTAVKTGRDPGTLLAWNTADWAAHPGDIVALSTLLNPGWRYPKGGTPQAWVDLAGTVWLGTTEALLTRTDTGQTRHGCGRSSTTCTPAAAPRTRRCAVAMSPVRPGQVGCGGRRCPPLSARTLYALRIGAQATFSAPAAPPARPGQPRPCPLPQGLPRPAAGRLRRPSSTVDYARCHRQRVRRDGRARRR